MEPLHPLNRSVAGIDIGSEKIFIAVADAPVVSFGTFTNDYLKAVAYLKEHAITAVAIEATGVYWIAFYDILEAHGIHVSLVNPRALKNVPGRKSDVVDCQWSQQLYSYGLLKECFVPSEDIRELRTYVRLRQDHITMAATHIQHMQKAFELMNVKLHNVLSDITGASGMRIIKAILGGEHNPQVLTELCEKSVLMKKRSFVIASLRGNFKSEYLFALTQAVNAYEFYQHQIKECDVRIEHLLNTMTDGMPPPPVMHPPKKIRHNAPDIDNLHLSLMKLTSGNDPSQITGLTDKTLLELIAETGTELTSHWATEKCFVNWAGLAPPMHQSGKIKKKRRVKKHSRTGQLFCQAAISISASHKSAFSAFFQRIKARRGFQVAVKATARKLAVLYYNLLTKGFDFVEQGILKYQQLQKERQLQRLKNQAHLLGLQLIPV